MHADVVLAHDVMEYAPLFVEIADAFFERDIFAEARPIYELLGTDAGVRSPFFHS
jgi:general transcription factor 3C polypeptide 3 (transcription factor C subunit 4)